jgi:hypothetical protein
MKVEGQCTHISPLTAWEDDERVLRAYNRCPSSDSGKIIIAKSDTYFYPTAKT